MHKFQVVDLRQPNYTRIFLDARAAPPAPPPAARGCNLILGPYGPPDGQAWDDLALSHWGARRITRLQAANGSAALDSLRLTYGDEAAPLRGREDAHEAEAALLSWDLAPTEDLVGAEVRRPWRGAWLLGCFVYSCT